MHVMSKLRVLRNIVKEIHAFVAQRLPGWQICFGNDFRCTPGVNQIELPDPLVFLVEVDRFQPKQEVPYFSSTCNLYKWLAWHEVGHAVHASIILSVGGEILLHKRLQQYREETIKAEILSKSLSNQGERYAIYCKVARMERVACRFATWMTGLVPAFLESVKEQAG